ncbi:uncharacterized protein LOC126997439 isoform X2 [Eriocheir sinensis]|uniref:uncharacterized protein LOC126997439 isoform X2 n=1 Tax=Eriocheir sinensis TaxID=95602 RepID=UPI0021C6BD04|nr:uncharacterized protein LOC126997439 isoform X2 [Eriocheir sinensis]XP_050714489.1 uncharacterized protein LOC126997439 isoform X2 [Eriocheir sinensis]
MPLDSRMRGVASVSLLALGLAVAWATDATPKEVSENEKEREETSGKNARQVYSYNRGTGYGTSYNGIYPSNIIPTSSYNPSYNPSYYPSYNPTVGSAGGVYPITPTVGSSYGESFTVRRASSRTTVGSRVILTQAVTQGGSGWNAASSEFVATSTGTFFFTFSAVSDRYTQFRVSLRHNGIEVVSAYGDASGYQMGSQSAVLNLRSGDRVYLQLDEGRLYDSSASSRGYTTFSGFRIR